MEMILSNSASVIALGASGIFFMAGLLTGFWKYICIRNHPESESPYYVNIAHRASLMYAFASHLLAVFAAISVFPNAVNMIAVILTLLFFAIAIIHYIHLGLTSDSKNSIRDSKNKSIDYFILNILTISEIGGFSVLLAGFFLRIFG